MRVARVHGRAESSGEAGTPALSRRAALCVYRDVARTGKRLDAFAGIGVALVACAALLLLPAAGRPPTQAPVPVDLAWPQAKRAAVAADLPDGTTYAPGLFLDSSLSIGSAPSVDGTSLRLLRVPANGPVQEIRRLPQKSYPSFTGITASGDMLVWVERTGGAPAQLWIGSVQYGRPRLLTRDVGDIQFTKSEDDLVIGPGRVYWAATGPAGATDVRSVALTGGAVTHRAEAGDWALSTWPWLVNGRTETGGATRLRNLLTGQDKPLVAAPHGITRCSPTWCRVAGLDSRGTYIELMHIDGAHRERIGDTTMAAVLTDPVPLGRFEIIGKINDNTALTNHVQLIAYEIATKRFVMLSPDAFDIDYRAGVLWWSTGNDSFVRHALDLRTVR